MRDALLHRSRPLVLSAMVLGAFLSGAPAAATADGPPVVAAASLSGPTARITGTGYGLLTVSVRLTSPSPILASGSVDTGGSEPLYVPCPCAVLTRAGAGPGGHGRAELAVTLHLTEGSATDGTWVGRVAITSGQAGIWRLRGVGADNSTSHYQLLAAPTDVSVNVRAVDWITVTTTASPPPRRGRSSVVTGVVRLARSHRPVKGLRLNVDLTDDCTEEPATAVRTDRNGRFRVRLRAVSSRDDVLWQRRLNGRIAESSC
ncbi:hypothetical protein [Motilibacter peucedani]|nr:hypothetical protein [Motilibacter peucedani]